MKININRLIQNVLELGHIGENSEGGVDRAFGSEEDFKARKWIQAYWENILKKEVTIDAIANIWTTQKGNEILNPIVLGSHHDAVPNGGKYDGALGVLMATEILETIIENNVQLRHSISLVSFTAEEPNPFGISTLGSKAISGRITKEKLLDIAHRDSNQPLSEAIKKVGGDFEKWDSLIKSNEMSAFLECHVEQGNRLEQLNLSTSNVSTITGIYREEITVLGEANHAGTTTMDSRKDALLGACEVALSIENILKKLNDYDVVGTIGYIKNLPNEANIISDKTKMILDIRISDDIKKHSLQQMISDSVKDIENNRKVKIQRNIILDQPAQKMDDTVIKAINQGIKSIGENPIELISMAGHDAANLATMTKSGMIFVKSIDGKSHCKEEYSTPEDIEKCANALLNAVLTLDKELD